VWVCGVCVCIYIYYYLHFALEDLRALVAQVALLHLACVCVCVCVCVSVFECA